MVRVLSPEEIDITAKRMSVSRVVHTKIIDAVLKSKDIKSVVKRACRNARGR